MKKIAAIVLSMLLVAALVVPTAFAARELTAGEKSIFTKLEEGVTFADGSKFTLEKSDISFAKNYLAGATALTEAQVNTILGKIDEAKNKVLLEGTGNTNNWAGATKSFVIEKIDECLQAFDTSLHAAANASTKKVEIVKNGTGVILSSSKLVPLTTGADVSSFVVAGLAGIVLLSGCVVVSKKAKLF